MKIKWGNKYKEKKKNVPTKLNVSTKYYEVTQERKDTERPNFEQ